MTIPADFKIAAICTTYYPGSHADVIVSRWLDPHPTDAQWGWQPRTRIASLYVAQFRPGLALFDLPKSQWRALSFRSDLDLAKPTAREYGVPIFDTIREALTLGGDALAVDGVLLIGEHGDYPSTRMARRCIHARNSSMRSCPCFARPAEPCPCSATSICRGT